MAGILCVRPCIPVKPPTLVIPGLPAGVSGVAQINLSIGCSNCDQVMSLLAQLQPFMMSMGPLFCILGCGAALLDLATSMAGILGVPPKFTDLAEKVSTVISKCACITGFLPTNFYTFLCETLKLASMMLDCVISVLGHVLSVTISANTMCTSSIPETAQAGTCLLNIVQTQQQAVTDKANVIGLFLMSLKVLFDLVGGVVPPGAFTAISDAVTAFNNACTTKAPGVSTLLTALNTLKTAIKDVRTVIACPA